MPKGTWLDPEARARANRAISERMSANNPMWRPEVRAKVSQTLTQEVVGYDAMHHRARKALPRECSECGTTERVQVALSHDAPEEFLLSDGRVYSLRVEDYRRLCRSCHSKYDKMAKNFGRGYC